MRHLYLLTVGKYSDANYRKLCEEYIKRAGAWSTIHISEIKDAGKRTQEWIQKIVPAGAACYCLDEHGKTYSSGEFAKLCDQPKMAIIIGGADGLAPELLRKYPCISLSRMTMAHELAKLVFLEQYYRGLCLLHNHPYHRG